MWSNHTINQARKQCGGRKKEWGVYAKILKRGGCQYRELLKSEGLGILCQLYLSSKLEYVHIAPNIGMGILKRACEPSIFNHNKVESETNIDLLHILEPYGTPEFPITKRFSLKYKFEVSFY